MTRSKLYRWSTLFRLCRGRVEDRVGVLSASLAIEPMTLK